MTVRIGYEKTGRAKYISHLDMTRCMSRALARSGLPVWFTQGFNPHIYMTFALPLSLGVESRAETMDFRLEEELPFDQVAARLNACLPEGIRVLWAGEPVEKPEAIAWAEYAVRLTYDGGEAGEMGKALQALWDRPSILVMKHTKKGPKETDIRPHIHLLDWKGEGTVLSFRLRTAAGPALTVNPSLLLERLFEESGRRADQADLCRTGVFTGEGKEFR